MYSASKCLQESTFFIHWRQFSLYKISVIPWNISDWVNGNPWICLKELCIFILEIGKCAECSRTSERPLVWNLPYSVATFPESCRSNLFPDISQYIRVVLKFPEETTNVYSFDLKDFILNIWWFVNFLLRLSLG